ncbi:hypothetical protein CC86DRAFT_313803 [Ophiobolus disseminans]|uniref:C2H2-type domain-containing protein n=1 Tax=Ophiobolus disseminans TaxID=1469910 RepID=A0A6A7AIX2_9PLEO|nr:hypothetical protein CC86DRAFT_313803 [Ophiobolus disseminans]
MALWECYTPKATTTDQFSPLKETEVLQKSSIANQKSARYNKFRIVPPLASAYRPLSGSGATRNRKTLRPKQEPVSPVMSGYGYSSSGQENYNYATAAYPPNTPTYTQTQVNQYYAQYQCYPPQPYQIIPDYYAAPVPSTGYPQPTGSSYDGPWSEPGDNTLYPPSSNSAGLTRSNSRTKTWTCDIQSCTSSANFTRLADLQRHQSTVHGVGTPEFPCTVPRCNRVADKGFTRRDHLVEHLRNFHHIDIPKRRPGERSAFPFGWPEGFQSQ